MKLSDGLFLNTFREVGQKYDVIYRDIEDSFRGFFGTKVKLNPKNESQGKIVIEYKTSGELERFLELIKKQKIKDRVEFKYLTLFLYIIY